MNIKQLIQQLADKQDEIYSKIGIVRDFNSTDKTVTVDLLEGGTVYDVMLSIGGNSYAKPTIGSNVIVTFLDRERAYVSLISNSDYTRVEIEQTDGDTSGITVENTADGPVVSVDNVSEFNVTTKRGGTMQVLGGDNVESFLLYDLDKILLQVESGSKLLIDEDGVIMSVPNESGKIKIGCDTLTIKNILTQILDMIKVSNYITIPTSVPGTATFNATLIPALEALQTRIDSLFD